MLGYSSKLCLTLFFIAISLVTFCQDKIEDGSIIKWNEGYLDIHFIHSGRGNVSFMLFPDGTSLLYDVGDAKQRTEHPYYPPFLDEEKTAPERVIKYINYFNPKDSIDYAVVGHFHNDHYGQVLKTTPFSKKGDYQLTGIAAVGDSIPYKNLIDRAFPYYNYPYDLRTPNGKEDKTMINYLKFIIHHQKNSNLNVEQLIPGSKEQITLAYTPQDFSNFSVRNVKSNGAMWTGVDDNVGMYPFNPPLVNSKGYYNENPLSIAFKISYGKFDYYVGGDIPGINKYPDYDIETPMGNIIGQVEAMTLDHHGHKDATNPYFISQLKPQVIAHQSLHDPHFAENVQYTLKKSGADVYSPYVGDAMKDWYKKWIKKSYKSTKGHFFIRVYPNDYSFEVFVLDETEDGYMLKQRSKKYQSK